MRFQFNALRSQVMNWPSWNDCILCMMMEGWHFKRTKSISPSFVDCLDWIFEIKTRKALHMLTPTRRIIHQIVHLHQPQLSGLALVFWCTWPMTSHKLNMSFGTWPPTAPNPLRKVWQRFDIWWGTFALRFFEVGWSSNWHFPRLSGRGPQWTRLGGVHWLWLGFGPCQQKVCELSHFDVWTVLGVFSIAYSEGDFIIFCRSWSLHLQEWNQWRHPSCKAVDMDQQQKNVDLHLHRQEWCERDFVSQRRWKVETFELPHFVATRDGWKWKAETL